MFSLFVLVLAVAFAGNLRLNSEMHVKDCGTEATLIHFTGYKVSDLERSEDLTFDSGYATLNKNVTSGEVRFYATRNSVGCVLAVSRVGSLIRPHLRLLW